MRLASFAGAAVTRASAARERPGAPPSSGRGERSTIRASNPLWAGLSVGPSGDAFEREAERAAEIVTSGGVVSLDAGPAPQDAAQPQCACGGNCGGACAACRSAAALEPPAGGGERLSPGVQARMEAGFGHDFSSVRVHHDAQAARSAAGVHARAFTLGSDVVFGKGMYAPESAAGARLLAHELAHVVQQGGGGSGLRLQPAPGDAVQRARDPHSVSDDVIDVEGSIAAVEGWQEELAGATAESNIGVNALSFIFLYMPLELLRRAMQLGNMMFGITELQDVGDALSDPDLSWPERIKKILWGLFIVAMSALMISKVASLAGGALARLGRTALLQYLRTLVVGIFDAALALARSQLPTVVAAAKSLGGWVLGLAGRFGGWLLDLPIARAGGEFLRRAIVFGSKRVPLPRFVEVLSEDVSVLIGRRFGSAAPEAVTAGEVGLKGAPEAERVAGQEGAGAGRTAAEAAEAPLAEVAVQVGAEAHELAIRRVGGRMEVWMCSTVCTPVLHRLDGAIAALDPQTAGPVIERLVAMRDRILLLESRLTGGTVALDAAKAELAVAGAELTALSKARPAVAGEIVKVTDLVHTPESLAQEVAAGGAGTAARVAALGRPTPIPFRNLPRGVKPPRGGFTPPPTGAFDEGLYAIIRDMRATMGTLAAEEFRLNLAAVKVEINGVVTYIGSRNLPGGMVHSEGALATYLAGLRNGGNNVRVLQLFTERIPCGHCLELLGGELFSEVPIFYVVNYQHGLVNEGKSRVLTLMKAWGVL